MKRLVSSILMVALMFCIFPLHVCAAEGAMEIIHLEDGSYITVETVTNGTRASGTVTGNKVSTHYSANGSTNWKAVLTGTFTYTGSSATCTSSSVNITIYDSTWSEYTKIASKSGNTATATVTMVQKSQGVIIARVPANMTLKCDANGNLS